ncbi:EamA family transporter [Bacillus smithii]|jgi:multidrug transporter EmrE-like cation transporter|uniref:EamA family transporter n=1 Tax=Bacillus smithii TaxID=1479 RepID=UPI00065E86B2|nr:EamA family transporter [Bacillus smithii]AKP48741.1 putative small multidrug resistance transmembrane protein [Bacillus smithii]MED1488310.1 EamA family transporter [Bacillus smithii]MED4883595.1 EamA family transporter [Bacillus smithii]MED4928100.1 EamA family transporter [Bacillus smithii]
MTPINFVLILVNTLILVSGQFLWKYGMMKSGQSFSSLLGILKLLLSPYILTGLILYGAATVLWLFILSKVPLSVAYPIQSLAYVFALFGAYFFFGETLTSWKIAGVLLIVAGVAMISVHSGR